jgi:hypothetical protein
LDAEGKPRRPDIKGQPSDPCGVRSLSCGIGCKVRGLVRVDATFRDASGGWQVPKMGFEREDGDGNGGDGGWQSHAGGRLQ